MVGAIEGCTGLEIIRQVKPDLVLLGLMMPDMNGDQVCHRLKDDDTLKHIPVVSTTAETAQKTRVLCEQLLKANGFVLKPLACEN